MMYKKGKKSRWPQLILLALILSCGTNSVQAQFQERIKQIKESDPITFSGSVGASMGISYNSSSAYHATPFTSSIYANLNFNFYSFNLPISFYFINNSTQFSYPKPTIRLGFTPTWNKVKLHLGSSSMHFSNYTYSGLTFLGAGVEYQGNLFRAAAFGGVLNRAVKPKGYDDRSAFQMLSDSLLGLNLPQGDLPQYRRDAVGIKLGVGNSKNFIDISFLKAKDKIKTLPEAWRDSIKAEESFSIGLSGRFAIRKWFAFTANLGACLYTNDLSVDYVNVGEKYQKHIDNLKWLYGVRYNSQLRFAGDASINFFTRIFNGSLTYRFIQPDYVSLGTTNFSQNTQSFGLTSNFNLFKGKSNLGLVAYLQRDNLNKKQMYTNQVATYTINWNSLIADCFSLNFSYNGIKQDQYNGTTIVDEMYRINQITHTATLMPSISITKLNTHNIFLNINYIANQNLNKQALNVQDVHTLTSGLGYGIDWEKTKISLSCGYDFTISRSSYSNYLSNTLNIGLNYHLFQSEKINLSFNYNGSVGYNIQEDEEKNNDVSVSNSIGSKFSYKKAHHASMYLSLSNYSENIIIGQKVATKLDCRFTLSYSYSFGVKLVKKKSAIERANAKNARLEKKMMKHAL